MTPEQAKDRVEKLIRLATANPSVEEARSAALKACELIVAHRLDLVVRAEPQPTGTPADAFAEAVRATYATDGAYRAYQAQRDAFRREKAYEDAMRNAPPWPWGSTT